tara:strand:+ start:492 stop:677 length:186 start_codon:yes stop_codon:yes gene_type:complete
MPKMKVGDLVRSMRLSSRSKPAIGLILAILDDGCRLRLQWIDTLEIDEGGCFGFEVISEGR